MSQRPDSKGSVPIRCAFCSALLAMNDRGVVRVARGQLEAVIEGTFRASIVCYRPHCRRLNVVTVPGCS